MLTLRPGSQAGRLAEMLSVTGEFPLRSLHLLGSERSFGIWYGALAYLS